MSKSKKVHLKDDEQKVLEELKSNSNKSINKIAKNCGFSRQKVWRIIKKFEKENRVWGYTAVVDEESENLNYFVLLLKRDSVPIPKTAIKNIVSREIDDHIRKINCSMVTSLYTNGHYDWIIIFTAPDIIKAKKVSELFRARYKDILKEVNLLETIFPAKVQGIVNPDIGELKNFF